MSSRGIFSTSTLLIAQRSGISPAVFIKRAALMFETLVFHNSGLGSPDFFQKELGGLVQWISRFAGENAAESHALMTNRKFAELLVDADSLVDDSDELHGPRLDEITFESEEVRDAADSVAMELLRAELGLREDEYTAELHESLKDLPIRIMVDLGISELLRTIDPEIVGLQSTIHSSVLERASRAATAAGRVDTICNALSGLGVPDFGDLTWEEILDLRSDGYVHEFQRAVLSFARSVSGNEAESAFREKLIADVWNLVREVRPHVGGSVIGGILGNLPLPIPVNPLSLAAAANDVRKQLRLKHDYGWLFFVQTVTTGRALADRA